MYSAIIDYTSNYNPASNVGGIVGGVVGYILTVIALWPVFTKAGKPGGARSSRSTTPTC